MLKYFQCIIRLQLCVIGNHSRYDIPHTHTFVSIVGDKSGSHRSIMCYRNEISLGHSSNTNYLFACIVCGETWFRPSIKLSCQSYVIDTLSLCTPYVWESTWFCLFLCVLSQRTVVRTVRPHHTSFRLCFLGRFRPIHLRQLSNIHN